MIFIIRSMHLSLWHNPGLGVFFWRGGGGGVNKYMDQQIYIIRLTLIKNKDRWLQK